MKKILLLVSFITLVALILCPTQSSTVSARAGGARGGGSHGSGRGGGVGHTTSTYYGGNRSYYDDNDNSSPNLKVITVVGAGFLSYGGYRFYRKKRNTTNQPGNTLPIDSDFEKSFLDFFYQVEEAWSQTDTKTLSQLMTPQYFNKQKRIINNWRRLGKINRLDSLAIIDLKYEATKSANKKHVIVTAQARDWFEYPNKSKDYNLAKRENTYIERFAEVWELVQSPDGWKLNNIRTIDL
ncbi:TIM44-like domain-containing protein [Holzapfeliella sp. JNUCC 72]